MHSTGGFALGLGTTDTSSALEVFLSSPLAYL